MKTEVTTTMQTPHKLLLKCVVYEPDVMGALKFGSGVICLKKGEQMFMIKSVVVTQQ